MAKIDFIHGIKRQMVQTAVADLGQTLAAIGGDAIVVTDDDSAAANGTALFARTLDGVNAILESDTANLADANFETAAGVVRVNHRLTPGAGTAFIVTDDDSAASNGVALYVVPVAGVGPLAFFESTTVGNADAPWHDAEDAVILVNDNDAPGGVLVYFDEDAANADSRFLCVSPTLADLFVPLSSGELVRVKHDASAASNGVQVYFDDNAADAEDRMLFISPTDTAGAGVTDDELALTDETVQAGVQVYFDEDGANTDERFLIVSPTGADLFVPVSNGHFIRLNHDASAASNGVAVYFDDNAGTVTLRWLFVSPTDTVGAATTDNSEVSGVSVAAIQLISDKVDVILAALRTAKILDT